MPCLTPPIRWAFDVSKWIPKKIEWDMAVTSIQLEEKQRIERFVFKEDTKSSLIGRLLMRKLCTEVLDIPYKNIKLGRDEKERPFLIGIENYSSKLGDFNISHQGNLCVLAAELNSPVGIDVMERNHRGVFPGNTPLPDFFNLMRRKFTSSEWDYICGPVPEKEQASRFYRNWSLKESYVKAEGSGLGFSLQRLSFKFNTITLKQGTMTSDTQLYIDGNLAKDWFFHETLLDDDHCTAVALQKDYSVIPQFTWLQIEDLLENAVPLTDPDPESWEKFINKPQKIINTKLM